jgi:hypothetical protein
MDLIIFFLFNYIIKNKEQFKMNKISNDKIEKKKSNEKIQQKPNIKNETKKKPKKKSLVKPSMWVWVARYA